MSESRAAAHLRALRPLQWTKNLLVLAPLLFAHKAFQPRALLLAAVAAGAFCLLSSAVYLLNDLLDRERDRVHPQKRGRPIASGAVGASAALVMAAALAAAALALFWLLGRAPLYGAAAYALLQLGYSFFLKRIAMLDVMIIALGFVLRVLCGAWAISVPVSNWLYLCTFMLALFLALGKRRAELATLQGEAQAHRANLSALSLPLCDQLLTISASASIVTYSLYALNEETVRKAGTDGLMWTIPCVVFGLFRYLYLIQRRGEGGAPERTLFADLPLLGDLALYLGMVLLILYAG